MVVIGSEQSLLTEQEIHNKIDEIVLSYLNKSPGEKFTIPYSVFRKEGIKIDFVRKYFAFTERELLLEKTDGKNVVVRKMEDETKKVLAQVESSRPLVMKELFGIHKNVIKLPEDAVKNFIAKDFFTLVSSPLPSPAEELVKELVEKEVAEQTFGKEEKLNSLLLTQELLTKEVSEESFGDSKDLETLLLTKELVEEEVSRSFFTDAPSLSALEFAEKAVAALLISGNAVAQKLSFIELERARERVREHIKEVAKTITEDERRTLPEEVAEETKEEEKEEESVLKRFLSKTLNVARRLFKRLFLVVVLLLTVDKLE